MNIIYIKQQEIKRTSIDLKKKNKNFLNQWHGISMTSNFN